MSIAVDEAKQVSSRQVYPNPRVGAAILCTNGQEFSSFHAEAGQDHAELRVFKLCEKNKVPTQGATLAVTLEPCSHHGKTPPCADAIIKAGIARVLIAGEDPVDQVSGEGIKKLEAAGIEVVTGVMQVEAENLNKEWLFAQRNRRPYVTLKMATSLDGKWKTKKGEDRWVTSSAARADAHVLRSRVQGLLTSRKTLIEDDPSLTAREASGNLMSEQPKPFILSKQSFSLSDDFKVSKHPIKAEVIVSNSLEDTLSRLYDQKIFHLMVEAGPTLSQSFMQAGLVDEVVLYMETNFFGASPFQFPEAFHEGKLPGDSWKIYSVQQLGTSTLKVILQPKVGTP